MPNMKHYALSEEFRSEFNFRCKDSIIPPPKSGDVVVPAFTGEEEKGEALRWLTLFAQWALQQGLSADHTLLLASTHIKYALIYYPQLPTWAEFIKDFFSYYGIPEDTRFAKWYSTRAATIPMTWFSFRELKTATNNFSDHKLIGSGESALVYKGVLPGLQRSVAVKKFKAVDAHSAESVLYQVFLHRSLAMSRYAASSRIAKLVGYSSYEEDPLLVYEYVPGGNLREHLQGAFGDALMWDERLKIGIDTAAAVTQLHYNGKLPIYHRDVKSSNILLDENRRAILADLSTATAVSHEKQQHQPDATGSRGYVDPHNATAGKLTDVADVYSVGVVLLELVTGAAAYSPARPKPLLRDHVLETVKLGRADELLDPEMTWDPSACEHCLRRIVAQVTQLALQCCAADPLERPKIGEVTEQLRDIQLEQKIMMMEIGPESTTSTENPIEKFRSKCSNMGMIMMMDKKKRAPSCRRRRY